MKKFSKSTNTFIIIVLLLAGLASYFFIENKTTASNALIFFGLLFLGFTIYLIASESAKHRQDKKIIAETERIMATILSVKNVNKNIFVLQLEINHPLRKYISSLVLHGSHGSEEERIRYQKGKNIYVYINPDNLHDIIIPEDKKEKINIRPVRSRWRYLYYLFLSSCIIGPIFVPLIIDWTDTSDRLFSDSAFICANEDKGKIWEVRVRQPDKIYINIYDPLIQTEIYTIKETEDKDNEDYIYPFICQQKSKVFIIGTGSSPILDIYDAVTFDKLSDIKTFEQSNRIFSNGIAEIQRNQNYNRISKESVIEITTKDGNKYFYNVSEDEFYNTDRELNKYFRQTDSVLMSKQLSLFVLSMMHDGVEKSQLNIVQSGSTKSVRELLQLAGSRNIDVEYFNRNKRYYYPNCELVPLSGFKYFLKGEIVYSDSSLAVVMHVASLGKDEEQMFTGIDAKGNTAFILEESDFPNVKEMQENGYDPRNASERKCIRYKDQIVFLFSKYGALCIDLTTGTQLWKYEP